MKDVKASRAIYLVNEGAVGRYNERTAKLFAEYMGAYATDGVGYVSVYGALGNGFWEYSATTYTTIGSCVEAMAKDSSVNSIVLLINSPGGMAEGLQDLCHHIKSVDADKPVYAYITGMACSAAYAIASSARTVYSVQEAETGCCGCYAEAFEVKEEAYEDMGFLHRVFRSRNAPKKNLSVLTDEEAGKEYQAIIDALGDSYLRLCADNRGVSIETAESEFGKGAVVSAEYALEHGMVDRICSLEEALEEICGCKPDKPEDIAPNTTLTEKAEGEGEEDMDINAMSADSIVSALAEDRQRELFDALCTANPSLITEREEAARAAESARIDALNSLRDGSVEVDAIVDAAVTDGRDSNAIALDVVDAMKKANEARAKSGATQLETLLASTQPAGIPREEAPTNQYLAAAERINKAKEE